MKNYLNQKAFTLIELSIVLVIIGLIVGSVLVGQELIYAAKIRATISQLQSYQLAAQTFRVKYGGLPGDLPDPKASQFGLIARATGAGRGDGNKIIQGVYNNGTAQGYALSRGETAVFWVDLSTAGLISETFSTGNYTSDSPSLTGNMIDAYLPPAKIGGGNYIYVHALWSTIGTPNINDGKNYWKISGFYDITNQNAARGTTRMKVSTAHAIDSKIDDGLPLSGRVTARVMYLAQTYNAAGKNPANDLPYNNAPSDTSAYAPSATTCYDNGNSAGATQQYSMGVNGGNNENCALMMPF